MQSRYAEIEAADALVLAVCTDPVEDNAKAVTNLKLDFPILSDLELTSINAYDLLHEDAGTPSGTADLSRPAVFILDRNRVVQWRHLTNNWRVRVRPQTVLEELAKIP